LPARGVPLARLAAEVLGDSHALDAGQAVATLVLRSCAADTLLDPDERIRDQWVRLGITVNELARPVLILNLRASGDSPGAAISRAAASGGAFSPGTSSQTTGAASPQTTGAACPQAAAPQATSTQLSCRTPGGAAEPVHLSLRTLLRDPPAWDVQGRDVFVCENPAIVAIAADALGASCAPLICTDGMPAAAQRTLLAQLARHGARLRYHGDFDWAGLAVGNFVMRTFNATPWRFRAEDYLAACPDRGSTLNVAGRVEAAWDAGLSAAMAQRLIVVHEEAVVESLLADLASSAR
jgi:hypothetical protein